MATLMSQIQATSLKSNRRISMIPALTLAASAGIFLLAGCGGMVNDALAPEQAGVAIQGTIHGGQQAVSNATIQLYAAQATGYGAASNAFVASTTTDGSGNFKIATYTCPAAPNDQVYIVATGGNTGSGVNANFAAMAALGTCSTLAGSVVTINEATTVAAAYALSGFMTDYAHVATSPTNYVGLTNAFATVNNLVNNATGQVPTSTPGYQTAPAGTTSATFRSTVPQAEIYTLANIIASCVNTNGVGGSSTNCATLFGASKSLAGVTPTDTIQSALNIALNPGANVGTLFGLAGGTAAPFAPTLGTQPNDWTIAINYIGGGLGGPATPVSQDASSSDLAIDAAGNVWISNFRSSTVTKLNNLGVPITPSTVLTPSVTVGGYTGGGLSNPNAIAIDTNGAAWIANTNATLSEFTSTGSPVGTGFSGGGMSGSAKGLAIDSANNIWVTSSVVTEFNNSGTPSSGSPYTSNISSPTGAIAIDASNNVWVVNGGNAEVVKLQNASGLPLYTSVATLTSATAYGSIDGSGQFLVPQGSPNSDLDIFNSNSTQPTTLTPASVANAVSTSVDGSGHIWIVNAGGTLGVSANVTELSSTGAVLSTSGTGYQGTGTALITSPRGSGLDGSGNLWISNGINISTVTEFVGIGTPTVTPLAVAVKNNTIGTKP
jgi:hypothetical protein